MAANLEGLAQPPEEQPEQEARRALVIAAHPDDADFGAAGTACLWSRPGLAVYHLLPRQDRPAAPAILGAQDVFFLDYEDGELAPSRQLLGDVVRHIRQLRPHAVFTHDPEAVIVRDPFINHSDHRATGLVAVDAVYPAARDRLNFPEQVAAGLQPHRVSEIYIWGSERANFEE